MTDKKVIKQSNINTGGGDNIAGNQYNYSITASSYVSELYKSYLAEQESELTTETKHELLEQFIATDEEEVVGLDQKLESGGMKSQTFYARSCKESYVKNLTKHSMYESAQLIHAFFLGKVVSGYACSVLPNLEELPPEKKFEHMRKAVLDPIELQLGPNPLRLHSQEIDGMAFFLTGKCMLKWHV